VEAVNIYARLALGALVGTVAALSLVYLWTLAFGPIPDADVAELVLMVAGSVGSLAGMYFATRERRRRRNARRRMEALFPTMRFTDDHQPVVAGVKGPHGSFAIASTRAEAMRLYVSLGGDPEQAEWVTE
jgi:hypothetical protein